MIRVLLPQHLRTLAGVKGEIEFDLSAPATLDAVLDAIEASYPMLLGTIRDHVTHVRRPFLRYFVCGEDVSHEPTDRPLPAAVLEAREPVLIVGAIAGG